MSLAYYFDHHVPFAICEGLRSRSIDILTTVDDGSEHWSDEAILQRATELGRLVFTQDADFLAIGCEWVKSRRHFAGLVYGHQLRITIGQAIRDLELIAAVMTPGAMRDRVEWLPLR
ncbi:MAG: DUF5615 family PIN-like protein [Pirellulaceae bacterium]